MIKVKFILTAICLILGVNLFAQSEGKIIGSAKDREKNPLRNMSVFILGTNIGTTTNDEGNFEFSKLPNGTYSIQISSVGFQSQVQIVTIKSNQTVNVVFEIYEKSSELQEVIVTGQKNSYIEPLSSISTRTSVPLKDVAQSVQAIPRTILNEQQAFKLNEGYRNAAGILEVNTLNDYVIRGFRIAKTNFLMNGQMGSMTYENPPMLFNAEKIEVLRGPSALLFGYAAPGGIVNFITKKPLENPYYNVNISGGSFNTFRLQSDFSSSLNKNKTLLYRLNIGYENAGSFVDFQKNETFSIAPSLTWKISSKSILNFELTYLKDDRTINYENGIPSYNNNVFAVPLSFAVHEPNDYSKRNAYQTQMNFKHYFKENIIFNTLINYNKVKANAEYLITYDVPDNSGNLPRAIERLNQDHDILSINNYLETNFSIGKVKNKVLTGIDFYSFSETYPNYKMASASSINIFHPIYGTVDKDNLPNDVYNSTIWEYKTKTFAGYIQDHIEFSDKLKGVIGLRYEKYDYKTRFDDNGTFYNDTSNTSAIIPRLGLIYQPVKDISIYGSYSVGFEPQKSNYPNSGGPFDPETSTQYELGIKSDLFNKRLISTLALYNITKQNVLTPDLTDPTGRRRVQTGEVQGKGIELNLTGYITNNWAILFNYAYNETVITKTNKALDLNKTLGNAPKHLSNLWTTYKFSDGIFKGLKFGGGFRYVSDRVPYSRADLKLPAYTILDGMVSYTYNKVTLSLNVNNITNKEHILGSVSSEVLRPGTPRNMRIGLNYTF